MKKRMAMLAMLASLSGCSVFVPYDQEFSCPGTTDYGKCISVQGAYSEALGGEVAPTDRVAGKHKDADHDHDATHADEGAAPVPDARQAQAAARNLNRYKSAEYAEMAATIEAPITPVVEPPKTLRTLVLAVATSDQTLYMPRYIYYFANDGRFVIGDYLSRERAKGESTLYPNGGAEVAP